jgi:hypothetical protein
MAKNRSEQLFTIHEPRHLRFTCHILDEEWEELKGHSLVTTSYNSLRTLLYTFVGLAEVAREKRLAAGERPDPYLTLNVEVSLVPK